MTQTLKGKTTSEADDVFTKFHDLVTGHASGHGEDLGKLAVFAGVSEFPLRVKCATLAWHACVRLCMVKASHFHGIIQPWRPTNKSSLRVTLTPRRSPAAYLIVLLPGPRSG